MMMRKLTAVIVFSTVSITNVAPLAARVTEVTVQRIAPDRISLSWKAKGAVDIYVTDTPNNSIPVARLVSSEDRDGYEEVIVDIGKRPYFLLRDSNDRKVTRVAERVLPLQQGSNFRDLGGYPAANGKTVRWGMIYRSGATPMLTDSDIAEIKELGLHNLIDLRSDEERVLAPTRIDGVPYSAIGYSMAPLIQGVGSNPAQNIRSLYRSFPSLLAPQLRMIFTILTHHEGPLAYNCSAGQDRTGFVTAMILTALGVQREVIFADYELSIQHRQPRYEMMPIDTTLYANNPVAMMFAHSQARPTGAAPQPLRDANGRPFLAIAFDEIDAKWGSLRVYLEKEVGLTSFDIQDLRHSYLE